MANKKIKSEKIITLLIPVYNEEDCLLELYNRLTEVMHNIEYDYKILFVNDGSTDKSYEIICGLRLEDKRIDCLDLARNYGKEIAMAAGLDFATGDAVAILDADLQDPPELLPEMITYWEQGFDDVFGRRISREGESWLKRLSSKWFYNILQRMTRVNIQKDTGDFRLLSHRAVIALRQYKEARRYTKGFFSLIGLKKKEVLFERKPRIAGKTKWNYFGLINLAFEGITSFSSAPLRLSTTCGFITAFIGFIYLIFIILKTIIFGDPVAGYPSLVSIILLIGGLQFIFLGIIGEYLGRVFDETKSRPLYHINEYNGELWHYKVSPEKLENIE